MIRELYQRIFSPRRLNDRTMQNQLDFAKSDIDKLERLAENFKWIYGHKDTLRMEYKNEYVAVKSGKILGNDIKLERLVKRLNLTNYDESIAIEFV